MFNLVTRWGLVGVKSSFRRILSLFDFGNLLMIYQNRSLGSKYIFKINYTLNTERHDTSKGGASKQLVSIQEATNNVKTKY